MGLPSVNGPPEGTGLQVREAASPTWEIATDPREGFGEFYSRMHGPLVAYAARFFRDKEEARDAESEAMMTLWWKWPALSLDKRNEKYAFRVLTNIIRAMKEANSMLVSVEDAGPELEQLSFAEAPSFHGTSGDARVEILAAALAAMPAKRREVLLLRYEEGFTYREVAETLGLAQQTINTHVSLAYRDLTAAFVRAGYELAAVRPRLSLPRAHPQRGDTND